MNKPVPASPAQISDEPNNNIDLCDCGHRREKHHHSRGLCEATAVNGHICVCSRFKYPKFDIKVEDAKLVVAARSRLEPVEAATTDTDVAMTHKELADSFTALFQPCEEEPVEAVSTTPGEVNCLEFGCTNYPTRGTHYCKKHLEVSTPLPQQALLHTKEMTEFEKWWDEQIRLAQIFLGSGDYWVSKGIAKKAWDAGREENEKDC